MELINFPKCGKKYNDSAKSPVLAIAIVALAAILVVGLIVAALGSRSKHNITVSEEFYEYATDTIDIVEDYLNYIVGYSYEYMDIRLSDLEFPHLPAKIVDKEVWNKESEIRSKTLSIHTYVLIHDENPDTRDTLKKMVDELKEMLDGVVIGEVRIEESQFAS